MPPAAKLYVTTNNLSYIGYILKQLAGKEIFDSAMSEDSVYPGHCTYYSLGGLTSLLIGIGFSVESASRVNFLPGVHFYRRRASALAKNLLVEAVPRRYATHLEVLCVKSPDAESAPAIPPDFARASPDWSGDRAVIK
jgi:hypothetical protein